MFPWQRALRTDSKENTTPSLLHYWARACQRTQKNWPKNNSPPSPSKRHTFRQIYKQTFDYIYIHIDFGTQFEEQYRGMTCCAVWGKKKFFPVSRWIIAWQRRLWRLGFRQSKCKMDLEELDFKNVSKIWTFRTRFSVSFVTTLRFFKYRKGILKYYLSYF
jgi:hypothetical protein